MNYGKSKIWEKKNTAAITRDTTDLLPDISPGSRQFFRKVDKNIHYQDYYNPLHASFGGLYKKTEHEDFDIQLMRINF